VRSFAKKITWIHDEEVEKTTEAGARVTVKLKDEDPLAKKSHGLKALFITADPGGKEGKFRDWLHGTCRDQAEAVIGSLGTGEA
jgi:hypothetical protein